MNGIELGALLGFCLGLALFLFTFFYNIVDEDGERDYSTTPIIVCSCLCSYIGFIIETVYDLLI